MATNNRGLSANEGHGNQQQGTVNQRGTWQPTAGDYWPTRDLATNSRGLSGTLPTKDVATNNGLGFGRPSAANSVNEGFTEDVLSETRPTRDLATNNGRLCLVPRHGKLTVAKSILRDPTAQTLSASDGGSDPVQRCIARAR